MLLRVGLHWRVPFIEVLSETTSGLVAGSHDSERMLRASLLKGAVAGCPDAAW